VTIFIKILFLEPLIPLPSVQQPQPILHRPRSPVSLPFTYTNAREEIIFPNNHVQTSPQPSLEKVIEVHDDTIQTTSSTNNIRDAAHIGGELNLTLPKREESKQFNPLLYSKAIVNHRVEFRQFRSISSRNYTTLSKKNSAIHIPVMYQNDISSFEQDHISLVKRKKYSVFLY
jgi:hypothetical protein